MPRLYLPLLCLLLGAALLTLAWTERGAVPLSELDSRPRASHPVAPPHGIEVAVADPKPIATPRPAAHADEDAVPPAPPPSPAVAANATPPAPPPDAAPAVAAAPRTHRLRLSRDGAGLAGIEVAVRADGAGTDLLVATSDATGELRVPLPPGDYLLSARGDGVSTHQAPFRVHVVADAEPTPHELVLRPRVRLAGRVLDADAQPRAAAITLQAAAGGDDRSAQSGPDGAFAFDDVAPGRQTVRAQGEAGVGLLHVDIADGEAVCPPLVLHGVTALRGVVTDTDGEPLAATLNLAVPADLAAELPVAAQVTTGSDGTFALELPAGAGLRVESPGCAPRVIAPDEASSAHAIRLERALSLCGTVDGATAGTQVALAATAGTAAAAAAAARAAPAVAVAADGTFRIDGLPRGRYAVSAARPGGRTPAAIVELPQTSPLRLQLVAGRDLAIRAVDDRGTPLPFATVRVQQQPVAGSDARADDAVCWQTDADGDVVAAVPAGALALRLAEPLHLPATVTVAADTPAAVLRAARASELVGCVADASDARHCDLAVVAWPQGGDLLQGVELALDDKGAFRSGPLPAGTWQLALRRRDRTAGANGRADGAADLPLPDLPLLGGGIDSRTTVVVDAAPGESPRIVVPAPAVARIMGQVLRGEQPLAGVAVFAVPAGDDGRSWTNALGWDASGSHLAAPHGVTDGDGRFCMLVQRPGAYDVRARHAAQPFAGAATTVVVADYGERSDVTLRLPTGSVRGRFAAAAGAPLPPLAAAMLFAAADAARDPFLATRGALAEAHSRLRLLLPADGAFEFVGVPPGAYVLRICDATTIRAQFAVTVDTGAMDLGELRAPAPVAGARVPVEPPPPAPLTARLLQELPGLPDGAFARSVAAAAAVDLGQLPPARYRVELLESRSGRAIAAPLRVELRGDGSCEPPRLLLPER